MATIAPIDTSRPAPAYEPLNQDDRTTIVVSFRGVERRFADVTALAGVDLTIGSGETVARVDQARSSSPNAAIRSAEGMT